MSRLFVAVHPPDPTLDELDLIPRPDVKGVRWTRRDQLHITLAFLGDVEAEAVVPALRAVEVPPVGVDLGPAVRMIRKAVVMIPAAGLDQLAGAVQAAVRPIVPDLPDRRFRGHLTLGRSRSGPVRSIVGHAVDVSFHAAEFSLMNSELDSRGASHFVVARFALESDVGTIEGGVSG